MDPIAHEMFVRRPVHKSGYYSGPEVTRFPEGVTDLIAQKEEEELASFSQQSHCFLRPHRPS